MSAGRGAKRGSWSGSALGVALAVVALAGCYPIPQTRADFVAAVERGEGASKVERTTIWLPFTEVVRNLDRHAVPCLNFHVGGRVTSQGATSVPSEYVSSMKVASERAELTVRRIDGGIQVRDVPEGGRYLLAADVSPTGRPNLTEIVIYGPSLLHDEFFDGLRLWAKGTKRDCLDT